MKKATKTDQQAIFLLLYDGRRWFLPIDIDNSAYECPLIVLFDGE
jgi:hypothetical protein